MTKKNNEQDKNKLKKWKQCTTDKNTWTRKYNAQSQSMNKKKQWQRRLNEQENIEQEKQWTRQNNEQLSGKLL